MGIWRFAGVFPVVERQKEMRAQNLQNARQPANALRRVLWVCSFMLSCRVLFQLFNAESLFVSLSIQSAQKLSEHEKVRQSQS